jgi:hypothetical protein
MTLSPEGLGMLSTLSDPEERRRVRHLSPFIVLLALATLAPLSGCGTSKPPTGSVHGSVTFDGKPVNSGNVIFENGPQGIFKASELAADGTYRVEDLPLVEYTICVQPPEAEVPNENSSFDGSAPLPKANVALPKDIPARYHKSHTSPERYTPTEGEQQYDIQLKK